MHNLELPSPRFMRVMESCRIARERRGGASAAPESITSPRLPGGGEGAPDSFSRSALFAAIHSKDRRPVKRAVIASLKNFEVEIDGWQLVQSDLDPWLHIVRIAREQSDMKNVCQTTGYSLLKAMGDGTGHSDYKYLDAVLRRLASCSVTVKVKERAYTGHLIRDMVRNDDDKQYCVVLDPHIMRLFSAEGWTSINVQERHRLRGKPLALWLHAFYSSHTDPFVFKVETLRHLCGSRTGEIREFRRALKTALAALEAVTGWRCALVDEDLVTVSKRGSC